MKKRKLIFSFIMFIILMIICLIKPPKVFGYKYTVTSLSERTVDQAFALTWNNDTNHISTWNYGTRPRENCIHTNATNSDSAGNLTLHAIIDIFPDGSIKYQYRTSKDHHSDVIEKDASALGSSYVNNFKIASYIAYWATNEQDHPSTSNQGLRKQTCASFGYLLFRKGWSGQLKTLTNSAISWSSTGSTLISSLYSSWPKNGAEKEVSLRTRLMFYYGTAGEQDRIFCWSKKETIPTAEIDKYIIKVKDSDGTERTYNDRMGKETVVSEDEDGSTGRWKQVNPAKTKTSESTVTYKVVIKNTSGITIKGHLKEAFDNRYFDPCIKMNYKYRRSNKKCK